MILRKCTFDDLTTLRQISHETYEESFAGMCRKEDMAAYLKASFCGERLQSDLLNEACSFYFLYVDGNLAGYLKLNESEAQTDINDPDSLELERIYVISSYQGRGLGSYLLKSAEDEGKRRGKSYLWLGVWEKNEKALAFYEKLGFYPLGRHTFVMGNDIQSDYLLRKDLQYLRQIRNLPVNRV